MNDTNYDIAFLRGFEKAAAGRLGDLAQDYAPMLGLGAAGAGLGYMSGRDKKNPENDHSIRNALIGLLGGGGVGYALSGGQQQQPPGNAFSESNNPYPRYNNRNVNYTDEYIRSLTGLGENGLPEQPPAFNTSKTPPSADLGQAMRYIMGAGREAGSAGPEQVGSLYGPN